MGTSAKRYGIETKGNLELERRLRGIETELAKLQPANADAAVTSAARTAVPQVSGLRVTGSVPGAVSLAWNAVSISDLKRYEIQFATTAGFSSDLQTFKVASTSYQFSTASSTGGGGGATWYARVRAVNSISQNGPYSVTLNIATGQAQTEDIGDDAVTTDQIDPTSSAGGFSVGEINTATIAEIKLQEGLKGRMAGLIVTRPSASTIMVSIGSTSRLETQLSAAMTKSIASTWVAGDGNGGLATGAVTQNTWYHVFLIKDDTNLVFDVGVDTSLTAVNLLTTSGYDRYRRAASFRTLVGSTDIIDLIQVDEEFRYANPVADTVADTTVPGNASRTTYTLGYSPLGISVKAIINIQIGDNGYAKIGVYCTDLNQDDESAEVGGATTTGTTMTSQVVGAATDDVDVQNMASGGAEVFVKTNTAQQIGIRGNVAMDAFGVRVSGWIDEDLRGAVVADTN